MDADATSDVVRTSHEVEPHDASGLFAALVEYEAPSWILERARALDPEAPAGV
ncbi:hypothetical protein [Ilumatobacter sp.]|uniref:hypothetical protein n=1 Tax=Ilumatobacter sp. TaxID=1967498 RepID=UPI003B5265F6